MRGSVDQQTEMFHYYDIEDMIPHDLIFASHRIVRFTLNRHNMNGDGLAWNAKWPDSQ